MEQIQQTYLKQLHFNQVKTRKIYNFKSFTKKIQYIYIFLFLGILLFVIGSLINIDSDRRLRNLRKNSENGYKIPYGGLFEYVSAANYFGEILEWWGFALAAK